MSINIPTFYVEQFSTNLALLLQQKGSRLRPAMTEGSYVGSQASPVDQIGAISAQPVTNRFAPMGRVDAPLDRRWVFPSDFDLPQLIDSFDKLRLIVDPESAYSQNAMYAMGRAFDDTIITAMFGPAKTGNNGGTTTNFLAANVVGVGTGSSAAASLNVAKLRAAKKLLMSYEVDLDSDPIFCAVTSKENDALLNEIQVINTDYGQAFTPTVVNGQIKSCLGINFIHTERLLLQQGTDDLSGTSTPIPIWAKSGMHFGMWGGLTADVSQRKDIQGLPFQVYVKSTFGATRIEEKKTIKVWCR